MLLGLNCAGGTRTTSEAATWGNLDHVAVEAIQPGYVLLSWVKAMGVCPEECGRESGRRLAEPLAASWEAGAKGDDAEGPYPG